MNQTPLQFGDTVGRFRIVAEMVNGKMMKVIQCNTTGLLYIPTAYFGQNTTEAAFGMQELWLYIPAGLTLNFLPIASVVGNYNVAGQNCYCVFVYGGSGGISCNRYGGGVFGATLWSSAAGAFTADQWFRYNLSRTSAGVFTSKVNGEIHIIGGTGSNPSAPDVTYTVSPYLVFNMPVGSKIGWSDQTGERAFKKLVIAK